MDNTNRCGLIRKHRNKLEKNKKTKKNKTMNLALHAPLPILTPQKVQMRKESKGSGGGRGIKRKTKIVQSKYYSKLGCHESGCHSPHLLHHTTAAHHPWTASPIIHCTHTFPMHSHVPIHHYTNHTAVTNHSFALILTTPAPHSHTHI